MTAATTIVTCVEAGALEPQVLLLAESLRTFGGDMGKSDIIAVKPRFGPPIGTETKQAFRRLGVEFVDANIAGDLSWWNNANKSCTMAFLEKRVSTPNLTWMDGDMMVLQPLDPLSPAPDSDFIARAGEGYLGSDGTDAQAPYWRKLVDLMTMGRTFDDFPSIVSWPEKRPIRAYWQTGIYTYAAATGLGQEHRRCIKLLLDHAIGSKVAGLYHQDQVSISLAVQSLGLRHSEYDARMNYNVNPLAKQWLGLLPMDEVKILHYHGSLYRENYAWLRGEIAGLPQDRLEMMARYAPLATGGTVQKAWRNVLKRVRGRQVKRFVERAVSY